MQCYKCQTAIDIAKPRRGDTCPNCHAYVHCCRNCHFYDPNVHNQCREPQAEWVADKERPNFCEYFTPAEAKAAGGQDRRQEALKKLNDLFKKK